VLKHALIAEPEAIEWDEAAEEAAALKRAAATPAAATAH
jgi:ATP-dependent Lon protease